MPPLLTPHALLTQTGDPHTQIHITNLQTTLPLAHDAWGRPNLPQPILLSCTISLLHPFTTASSSDTVTPSTVHYGTLSKAILAATKEFTDLCTDETCPVPMHLRALVQFVHFYLTGWDTLPRFPCQERVVGDVDELKPLLKDVAMRLFELEVLLPKASLMGSGVSLRAGFGYDHGVGREMKGPSAYSMVLRLRDLKVPTLVGVNPNERLAKQIVYVDVEMQRWDWMVDGYCALEEIVVKSTEESSFQTLEALAQHLIERIIQYILIPHSSSSAPSNPSPLTKPHIQNHSKIKISLSKPTAVMFADAPTVEMVVDSDPEKSQVARGVWERVGKEGGGVGVREVPFPLVGRLDEWIARGEGGK
ncbi:Dihydroneopterin aldolase-domain-containing protein [Leptodontidium sp. MPI-SDFR-AT-0119]|nr:Dihydroneopterin aldolase-domain-containing protein [Leptodontidium sp. MPI-SDFR-AT-0119]